MCTMTTLTNIQAAYVPSGETGQCQILIGGGSCKQKWLLM